MVTSLWQRGMSLRRRLMLFAMLSALPALVVVAVQFAQESRRTSHRAASNAAVVADQLASDLGKLLLSVESVVHAVGTLGSEANVSAQQCSTALARVLQSYSNVINLSMVGATGGVLCSAVPPPPGVNFSDRPYFQEVMKTGNSVLSGYTLGRVTKKITVQLAVPIKGADGSVKAMAIAAIEGPELIPRLLGPEAQALTIALLDRDGVLLGRVPQPLPASVVLGKSYTATALFAAFPAQRGTQPADTLEMQGLDGVERIYALRQVMLGPQVAFHLAVGSDLSAQAAAVKRQAMLYVLAVLLTAAVVVSVAVATTRPLVLERTVPLLGVARRAQQGDYSGRTPVTVRDDLTPIEEAINGMLASMESDKARVLALSERNRLIAEATNDAIYDWNLSTGEFWCNHLPCQPVLADPDQAMPTRQDWLATVHPDDQARVRASLDAAIERSDDDWHCRYRVLRPEGATAYFVEQARLFRDGTGRVTRLASGARNVTDEVRAELALRDSEARYRLLFQNSLDGVLQTGVDGSIISANPAFCTMLGYTEAQIQSLGRGGLVDTSDPRLPVLLEARQKYGHARGELRMVRSDGTKIEVELTSSVYDDSDGHHVSSMVVRDNSDKKAAEEKILQLNRELEARVRSRTAQLELANRELEAFSYSVSHDLRGPLSTLSGFSKLLEDAVNKEGNPRMKHLTQRIQHAARDMGELIEGLLSLAYVSRAELQRGSVDLSALANTVVHEHREREPQRQVDVRIEAGLASVGDARLLRVVLNNLIGNAWKFTARSSAASIQVGQRTDTDQGRVFFVRDNGAGFDMAYANKLFGTFQRLHAASEYSGSGIGLATVQRIVQRHGGKVWAEASPGQGATFYFTLNDAEFPADEVAMPSANSAT
ncbi:ATP-binding protein [Polaromonas sp. YR568]|uniref:ATP-binding protein n=1 Tax=Polaromonas sp. YR568 TaxID=1855301 RepID=UPI0031382085